MDRQRSLLPVAGAAPVKSYARPVASAFIQPRLPSPSAVLRPPRCLLQPYTSFITVT